jgi:hypothetical protein
MVKIEDMISYRDDGTQVIDPLTLREALIGGLKALLIVANSYVLEVKRFGKDNSRHEVIIAQHKEKALHAFTQAEWIAEFLSIELEEHEDGRRTIKGT